MPVLAGSGLFGGMPFVRTVSPWVGLVRSRPASSGQANLGHPGRPGHTKHTNSGRNKKNIKCFLKKISVLIKTQFVLKRVIIKFY